VIRALFVIPAMFAGSACQTANVFDTGEIVTESGANIIYVSEHAESFDANSGDTVVIVYSGANPDSRTDCEDSGGTFTESNSVLYCWDIDF
jgi:hypothetical protein